MILGQVIIEKCFDHNIHRVTTEGTVSNDMLLCASTIAHCLFQSDHPYRELTVSANIFDMNKYNVAVE